MTAGTGGERFRRAEDIATDILVAFIATKAPGFGPTQTGAKECGEWLGEAYRALLEKVRATEHKAT